MVNFPNSLSLARIVLVFPLVFFLSHREYWAALLIFIAAALTDAVDGLLARLLHQRTVLGSYLDPVADKILMSASFLALALLEILPGWLAGLVIGRDLFIIFGLIFLQISHHRVEIRPSMASKLATILQVIMVASLLLVRSFLPLPIIPILEDILVGATASATVISGLQYLGKGIKILGERRV